VSLGLPNVCVSLSNVCCVGFPSVCVRLLNVCMGFTGVYGIVLISVGSVGLSCVYVARNMCLVLNQCLPSGAQ